MQTTTQRTPAQKENARHGEQMFPLKKYLTILDSSHPTVFAHWHDEAEFTLVTEGSGVYQVQLQTYEVTAGDFIFLPPTVLHAIHVPHGGYLRTETYVFHMHFLGMHAADICAVRYLTPLSSLSLLPPVLFSKKHPAYQQLSIVFSDLNLCYETTPVGYELLMKADFLRLLAQIIPYCHNASAQTALNAEHAAKLKAALEYITQHYTEELSIGQLAALCYFSEYYFMRFFKKYMGISCLEYIKNLRLEKAAKLLAQGELSVLEVSLTAGFRNLSYFYREFKKKYGVTPKSFAAESRR